MRKNLVERVFNRFLKSDWGEKGIITSINVHELNKAWGCRTFLSVLWQVLWHEAWVGWTGCLRGLGPGFASPATGAWRLLSNLCLQIQHDSLEHLFTATAPQRRTLSPHYQKKRDYFHDDELVLGCWAFSMSTNDHMWSNSHVRRRKFFFFTNVTERRVNRDENRHRKSTTWAFTTGQQDRGRGAGGQQTLQMNRPK